MSLLDEPVRVYLYGVGVAVVALLVGLGVVTEDIAPLILAAVAAVLGVPAVESARRRVTPTSKLPSSNYPETDVEYYDE